ncbi:MAG: hypothetical protein GY749_34470, partial [Desulfobacteraceae bacterium]|nr:hypothetical protein [Desulfobacteraceae bacterium]
MAGSASFGPFGSPDGAFSRGFGFRGELHVADEVHLRARYMAPGLGRFTAPDPLPGVDGTPTVANPYHYADNDPLNKIDPLGLRPDDGDMDVPPTPNPGPSVCGVVSIPGRPSNPTPDPGAGRHGSEPWYSRGADYAVRELAYRGADFADHVKGWDNAAANLRHYLGNSGDAVFIDPYRIAGDVSQFGGHLDAQARSAAEAVAEQAIADGNFGCPIPFSTGWSSFYLSSSLSQDWFYALGGVSSSATGTVTVYQGSPPEIDVSYQSHLWDRYNWDAGKAVTLGPITIEDETLAKLHRAGVA